jgi:hypothetical protein
MKVNAEVFDDGARMRAMGIPPFVGLPLVSSFIELARDFDCIWFSLEATEGTQPDFYFPSAAPVSSDCRVRGPLGDRDICQIVGDDGRVMSWGEAIDRMSDVRAARGVSYGRFPLGRKYKPVYFFIPVTDSNDERM